MVTRQRSHMVRILLPVIVLFISAGALAIQTLAEAPEKPQVVKSGEGRAEDPGDTQKTTRKGWDKERDSPPPIASDDSVKYNYPIVYVRVPRPYPKKYYG